MFKIFITGSADGLGYFTACNLHAAGHEVVIHVRNKQRIEAVRELVDQGCQLVIGDLSDLEQMKNVADQVNRLGEMDVIIHNAGVYAGDKIMPVNIVAPYVLTSLITLPRRLIYLSSSMHLGGRAAFDNVDWFGGSSAASYSDSKLFVTTLAAAVARLFPDTVSSSVNPGWVPTKMGGSDATDGLRLGHLTQEWLATSEDPAVLIGGGYWHHQNRIIPHVATQDVSFQNALLNHLRMATGIPLSNDLSDI